MSRAYPESARTLLQARYDAYVRGDVDFLIESVHPEKRAQHDRKSIEAWAKNAKWQGLEVQKEEIKEDQAWLTFLLQYEEKGETVDHRERAEFRRTGERWYYWDSRFPRGETVHRDPNKVGRNDPCPCGSGKKFKKCCGT